MRLLVVAWNTPPRLGGAERMVESLLRHLSESAEVTLMASSKAGELEGVRLLRSPWSGFVGFLLWVALTLPRRWRRGEYDALLSVNALLASLLTWCAPREARPREVALVFGRDLEAPGPLMRWWLRVSLAPKRRLLAVSEHVARLAEGLGLAPGQIGVLTPGVDPELAAPIGPRRARSPGSNRSVLLFVGRTVARKGLLPFLERCLPLILAEVDTEVWIVGADPVDSLGRPRGEMSRVRSLARQPPWQDRVQLLGRATDEALRGAYARADLLILPAVSRRRDVEGFGLVFLEAALFGVPAVSTRIGGIPEAVVHATTGLLVEPSDWGSFAQQVLRLLGDRELREALGENARRRALESFTWQVVATRCLGELERLAE